MLQDHMLNVIIGGVMPWKTHVLCFVLTATLTSIKHCNGRTADVGAVLQRRTETISAHSPPFGTLQGTIHLRNVVSDVKHESVAPTRGGSLAFRFDHQKPTTGKLQIHSGGSIIVCATEFTCLTCSSAYDFVLDYRLCIAFGNATFAGPMIVVFCPNRKAMPNYY